MELTSIQPSKILLVDDNPVNLGVLFDYLTSLGFTVLIAQNGKMAFQILEADLPDIILLDVKMPGMDGFEVCRRLKQHDETKDIPVIFMTALSETADKISGFEVGGVDYITKPFQQEEVLARVKAHLTICQLQQDLQQKNQALEEANASKDKFFSIIAHDLRSPFTGLLGITDILAQEIDNYSKDNIKKMLLKLKSSAERLFKLLENLLTWSRIQRGTLEHCPQQLPLHDMVAHNIMLFASTADQKQISLQNTVNDGELVYADAEMLDTILRNLLSNGIKFTPQGGTITIASDQAEDHVLISVTDTGIGIREDMIADLFRIDVKYQRRGTDGETGTGLGLVLCKELVEQNGGTIRIESQKGKGTTFQFILPKPPSP